MGLIKEIFSEIKDVKKGKRELRNFALSLCVFLGIIGSVLLYKSNVDYIYFYISASLALAIALFKPAVILPFFYFMLFFGFIIAKIVNTVILCILFYLVITPIGLLCRISGKPFMNVKFKADTDSYWVPVKKNKESNYEKQF